MERLTSNNPLTESEAMNLSLTNLYARLKAYEDAEEQGRLIVLPCKVGDTKVSEIDVAAILYKAADAIRYMERMSALHDCNDCGRKGDCPIMPNYGAETRINCFFWSKGNEPATVQIFRMMNEKGREE